MANGGNWDAQLKKGLVELCILAMTVKKERYGYELTSALSSADGFSVPEGTVYPVLRRLAADGLLESRWEESNSGPPRKYYRATPKGVALLDKLISQWRVTTIAVDRFINGIDQEV
ncbi:MAG TPA: PadR family transcriptional regulator [Anaerolineae bacterium]|jgi:PadR family transcriptional regulator PadR|nr:PadR family transcriptional regulator [Anaerolineae bacterium]